MQLGGCCAKGPGACQLVGTGARPGVCAPPSDGRELLLLVGRIANVAQPQQTHLSRAALSAEGRVSRKLFPRPPSGSRGTRPPDGREPARRREQDGPPLPRENRPVRSRGDSSEVPDPELTAGRLPPPPGCG